MGGQVSLPLRKGWYATTMRTPQKPFHAQLRLSSVRKLKMSLMEREAKWKDVHVQICPSFLSSEMHCTKQVIACIASNTTPQK